LEVSDLIEFDFSDLQRVGMGIEMGDRCSSTTGALSPGNIETWRYKKQQKVKMKLLSRN
jgi:hypothetical protein